MEKGPLLYEGKAKKVYSTDDTHTVWVEYKDSATAFNGEKKAEISGKGRLNSEISVILFRKLSDAGIINHFVKRLSETEQLVKKVFIIPLEVVVRNAAAGSLSRRLGIPEGTELEKPIVEFYYKDDSLGDPLVTEEHIRILGAATRKQLWVLRRLSLRANEVLRVYFASCGLKLVDFKLEFGVDTKGKLILADEISPDTCRLWDTDTGRKLDKDVFRQDLGDLVQIYGQVLARLMENT